MSHKQKDEKNDWCIMLVSTSTMHNMSQWLTKIIQTDSYNDTDYIYIFEPLIIIYISRVAESISSIGQLPKPSMADCYATFPSVD